TCDMPVGEDSSTFDALSDHSKILSDSNNDCTSSDDNDFEDIEYVDASPSDSELVSLEKKLLNINRLIANIKSLKDNPSPDRVLKSPSSVPISVTDSGSFFEESDTSLSHLDNSLPEFEPFSDDTEETRSGSTTTRSDLSLPDYEAFYSDDDHIKEKSSGSTTTHADFSQYDSFIFDLSIDSFPPADRSDFYHEEFADELAHIISPPEYDSFLFEIEPDQGELTNVVTEEVNTFLVPEDSIPGIESNFDPGGGYPDFEDSRVHSFVHLYSRASYPQLHLGNPIS
ncbi:hypothetical protein Tco_0734630, partial [Tanacetum coccineum]